MDLELIQRVLSDAPEAGWHDPDLLGWKLPNGLVLCAECSGRIMTRGFDLPDASTPLWRDREFLAAKCAGCGKEVI